MLMQIFFNQATVFFKAWFSNLVWNGMCFAMGTTSPIETRVLVCCDQTCLVQDIVSFVFLVLNVSLLSMQQAMESMERNWVQV